MSRMLPMQADLRTMRIINRIMEEIKYTAQEVEGLNIVSHPNGVTTWDASKEGDGKTFHFDRAEAEYLRSVLKELDTKKLVTIQHLPLYLKLGNNSNEGSTLPKN